METSFANAGELGYGMTSPRTAPGVPLKAVEWLMMKYRPLFIRPLLDPDPIRWAMKMLGNCD